MSRGSFLRSPLLAIVILEVQGIHHNLRMVFPTWQGRPAIHLDRDSDFMTDSLLEEVLLSRFGVGLLAQFRCHASQSPPSLYLIQGPGNG